MTQQIAIADFFKLSAPVALIDVRTPAEFEQGHIPGAFNLPLFSNDERVIVGTTYKQVGREEAILLGFDLTGAKWSGFIKEALIIAPSKKIGVHCWRGGMRSGAMAWALNLYGFDVYLIEGGYKKYRGWVHQQFDISYRLLILGGMTGSQKTKILHRFKSMGRQIVDLEDLAQHQGSAYGSMNVMVQPTQEQFENNFANSLKNLDPENEIWIEDESLTIGKRSIPNAFWNQMRAAVLVNLNITVEQRINTLVQEYGYLDKDFLIACTTRIGKRLGPEQTKHAIEAIIEGRMAAFIKLVLVYYDKTYSGGLAKRSPENIFSVTVTSPDVNNNAEQILTFTNEMITPDAIK